MTLEIAVLLGVCGSVVIICENLAIFIFNKDVFKWYFFKIVIYGEFYFRMKVFE